jgi:hypothetical protein
VLAAIGDAFRFESGNLDIRKRAVQQRITELDSFDFIFSSHRTVIPLKVKRNLWVGYATNFESWITFIVAFLGCSLKIRKYSVNPFFLKILTDKTCRLAGCGAIFRSREYGDSICSGDKARCLFVGVVPCCIYRFVCWPCPKGKRQDGVNVPRAGSRIVRY